MPDTVRIAFHFWICNTVGMELKTIIKSYRKQHGLSRQDCAVKLQCSESFVQLIENGSRGISIDTATKWAPILGIPREKLIFAKAA